MSAPLMVLDKGKKMCYAMKQLRRGRAPTFHGMYRYALCQVLEMWLFAPSFARGSG